MEHACHQCGSPVEDGVAFCPHCEAPQIRVAGPEQPPPPVAEAQASQTVHDSTTIQPPATPGAPALITGMDWSQALPGAALAGLILAFCLLIPFAAFFVWIVATGALAVALYVRRVPSAGLTPGMGARLGAVSGLLGFGMFAVLVSVELLISRNTGKLREMLMEVMRQSAAANSDPNAQAIMQRMMTPEGMALLVTLGMVLLLICFLLFSSLGGALGAYLLRKKDPQ